QLRRRLADAVKRAKEIKEVGWTRPTMSLWEQEYARLTALRPGAFGKATSRGEAHALRLALLYALMDRSNRIEPEQLQAALALWDYCERSARYIFGDRTGDRDADRILEALRSAPNGMTRSEIRRGIFGDHKPAEHVASKLGFLFHLGLVQTESLPTGGRSAER